MSKKIQRGVTLCFFLDQLWTAIICVCDNYAHQFNSYLVPSCPNCCAECVDTKYLDTLV